MAASDSPRRRSNEGDEGEGIDSICTGGRRAEGTDVPYGLFLLGGFRFSVRGDAVERISPGSQRLLAFLALRGGAVTRKQVAGTLWAQPSDQHAYASLRSASLRLEGPARHAVTVTGKRLRLAEEVTVDVHRARRLARRLIDEDDPLAENDVESPAISALSDDLLPGWYDDWVLIADEEWRQLRRRALEAAAARLTDADRFAEAAVAALAAVRAEPLRESARASLIRVHMAQGNQSEALREFERYRVLLQTEIGVEPTSRLSRLLSGLEQL